MRLPTRLLLSTVVAVLFFKQSLQMVQAADDAHKPQAQAEMVSSAVCVLHAVGKSGVAGTILFVQTKTKGVQIIGTISGLTPGKHGFHIHEFGDLTSDKDGNSAGGHFNPHHMPHGAPEAHKRHIGDLGNVEANAVGVANIDVQDEMITLNGVNSIIGRSVVVHAQADQFTQPVGNAGARVAFGVVGIANPKSK